MVFGLSIALIFMGLYMILVYDN